MTVMDQTGEVVVTTTAAATTTTLETTTGATPTRSALRVDADTQESIVKLLEPASGRRVVIGISRPLNRVVTGTTVIITTIMDQTGECGQAGHLQKDCKKNTTASTSGQADKKPGASDRVFTITEDHATKTS
nr:hypothetical protein [Tanacetum cinerariifolium]